MTRPIYETEAHRKRQSEALRQYQEEHHPTGRFIETVPLEFFDAILVDAAGKQLSIWEVKSRDIEYEALMAMGGLFLSLWKYNKLATTSFFVGIPAFILLDAPDGLYVRKLDGHGNKLTYGGREDRDDPKDKELCVLLKGFERAGP